MEALPLRTAISAEFHPRVFQPRIRQTRHGSWDPSLQIRDLGLVLLGSGELVPFSAGELPLDRRERLRGRDCIREASNTGMGNTAHSLPIEASRSPIQMGYRRCRRQESTCKPRTQRPSTIPDHTNPVR